MCFGALIIAGQLKGQSSKGFAAREDLARPHGRARGRAMADVEYDEDAAMDDGAAPKRGGKGKGGKGVKTKGRGHDAAKTDGDRYEGRGGVFEVRAASRARSTSSPPMCSPAPLFYPPALLLRSRSGSTAAHRDRSNRSRDGSFSSRAFTRRPRRTTFSIRCARARTHTHTPRLERCPPLSLERARALT